MVSDPRVDCLEKWVSRSGFATSFLKFRNKAANASRDEILGTRLDHYKYFDFRLRTFVIFLHNLFTDSIPFNLYFFFSLIDWEFYLFLLFFFF